jgi:hypothetical protein
MVSAWQPRAETIWDRTSITITTTHDAHPELEEELTLWMASGSTLEQLFRKQPRC